MGRIYLGKHIKDIETAEDSMMHNTMISSTAKKSDKISAQMTVSAQLQSDHQIDDFWEKKRSKE